MTPGWLLRLQPEQCQQDGGEGGLPHGFVDCNTDPDRDLPGTRNYEGGVINANDLSKPGQVGGRVQQWPCLLQSDLVAGGGLGGKGSAEHRGAKVMLRVSAPAMLPASLTPVPGPSGLCDHTPLEPQTGDRPCPPGREPGRT